MRALAEFIMRGRWQASVVALLGNLVPLLSPAAVGLVALRRGLPDGILVLLWACLPLVAMLFMDAANTFVMLSSVAGLVVVLVAAEVLKGTVSWPLTLLSVVVACSVAMVVVSFVFATASTQAVNDVQAVLVSLKEQVGLEASPFYLLMAATATSIGVEVISMTFVLGFMSWLTALNVIASLMLARWWQALLVNPGGFQQEFHSLRMDKMVAVPLLLAVLLCNLGSAEYGTWGSLLGMPLLVAGLGLAHYSVKARGMGTFWLVLMYMGLVLVGPLSMVLIVVAFLDSFMNFRARLDKSRGSNP